VIRNSVMHLADDYSRALNLQMPVYYDIAKTRSGRCDCGNKSGATW
jgi:hypothetical protein